MLNSTISYVHYIDGLEVDLAVSWSWRAPFRSCLPSSTTEPSIQLLRRQPPLQSESHLRLFLFAFRPPNDSRVSILSVSAAARIRHSRMSRRNWYYRARTKLCCYVGSWTESEAFLTVRGGAELTGGHERTRWFNFATLLPIRPVLGLYLRESGWRPLGTPALAAFCYDQARVRELQIGTARRPCGHWRTDSAIVDNLEAIVPSARHTIRNGSGGTTTRDLLCDRQGTAPLSQECHARRGESKQSASKT